MVGKVSEPTGSLNVARSLGRIGFRSVRSSLRAAESGKVVGVDRAAKAGKVEGSVRSAGRQGRSSLRVGESGKVVRVAGKVAKAGKVEGVSKVRWLG